MQIKLTFIAFVSVSGLHLVTSIAANNVFMAEDTSVVWMKRMMPLIRELSTRFANREVTFSADEHKH